MARGASRARESAAARRLRRSRAAQRRLVDACWGAAARALAGPSWGSPAWGAPVAPARAWLQPDGPAFVLPDSHDHLLDAAGGLLGEVTELHEAPPVERDVSWPAFPPDSYAGRRGAAVLRIQRAWRRAAARRRPTARPGSGPGLCQKVQRCRFGAQCPFFAVGRCRYGHPPDEFLAGAARAVPCLLERMVIQQHATGVDMHTLFARWSGRAGCSAMTVHDPYICCVRRASELYPAADSYDPDALLRAAEAVGVARCTGLAYVEELIEAVNDASPGLRSVTLVTRGQLRSPDVPVGLLLDRWCQEMNASWAPRGVRVTVAIDERQHVRRVVFEGECGSVEVGSEWGLCVHVDTAAK